MSRIILNSIRAFAVVFIEGVATYSNPRVTLIDILYDESNEEWKYAIEDNIDAVLDLQIGERVQMQFNRDNPDSLGFIKRLE